MVVIVYCIIQWWRIFYTRVKIWYNSWRCNNARHNKPPLKANIRHKGQNTIQQLKRNNLTIGITYHTTVEVETTLGGGPRVVVSTAAFHARVRDSVPGLGGLKETKNFLPHPRVKVSIVGSLRDREVACSASDRQGSNFESCVWRTVSSQSSHHPQEVLLAQFSLYVHKGGLKPDSFHFHYTMFNGIWVISTYTSATSFW